MSLDFVLTNIKDYKDVCWQDDELVPMCESIVWATMAIGLPVLDENTWPEWEFRLAIMYVMGKSPFEATMINDFDVTTRFKVFPTKAKLEPFFGLRTNVMKETRPKWLKNQTEFVVENARKQFKWAYERAEKREK